MAIKSSGPLSFTEIQAEFGGSFPYRLQDYYKGGSRIDNAVTAPIPSSGTIRYSDFYGSENRIEPPIGIGGFMHNRSVSRTFSGNGSTVDVWDDTYSSTALWKPTTWRWTSQVTCSASYTSLQYSTQLWLNGSQIASGSTPCCQNSFFRYNSGTRTHTFDFSVNAGDTIRIRTWGSGRQVGGSTPNATMTATVVRLT